MLIVIFVALLVVVLTQNKGKQRAFEEQQAAKEVPFFPDFNPDAVANIKVEKLQDSLEFKKEGGYWMVGNAGQSSILKESMEESEEETGEEGDEDTPTDEPGEEEEPEEELRYFRADETLVSGILSEIEKMKREEKVSSDPEKKTEFYVLNSIVGIDVRAEDADGNEVAHFIVGKAADMMSMSNYVRQADEDDIYEVRQALQNLFGRPFHAWRDKGMFDFDYFPIDKFRLLGTEEGDIEFYKDEEGGWHCDDLSWDFDEAKLSSAVENMSFLEAQDFAGPYVRREETGLDDPKKRVIASGPEGSFELIIGELTDDGKYHCSTGDDDSIFMVNEPDIKGIFLGRKALERVAPPEVEEEEGAG